MPFTEDPLDLRYHGGKGQTGLWQWIVAHLPPHVFYVEPFVGKGGVFRNKPPALHSTLIDLDRSVVRWWNKQQLAVRDPIACGDDVRGHRRVRRSCRHTTIIHGDGIEHLERAADDDSLDPDTLYYLDSPYHKATRSRLDLYAREMSDRDHRRMLRAATRLRCPVVISGYNCPLYQDRLADWTLRTRQVITRGRTLATECLWSNAPAAAASTLSVTYDQLGSTFRERERVKRLIERRGLEFRDRKPQERRALILHLLAIENELSHGG